MKHKKRKQSLTLLEIMIVIFLIGLIGSVIGYNVKGSLEEGKAFRSEQGAAQIRDVLLLEVAKGYSIQEVIEKKEIFLQSSGLIKDVQKSLKDGWGVPYVIVPSRYHTDILVKSEKLKVYKDQKKAKIGLSQSHDEDDSSEGDEE
ncbi:MAG: type II secretion system protein [Chlamydiae bacterium]|nr:type II secretion system protein [Chlamydiota bacterium]